jgi:DNA-directed RNA polymerase specialized sigma24 family protein
VRSVGSEHTAAYVHFEREWPWVRGELLRVLRGRQVPAADAEDIVQEVAARALAAPQTFATREDLARWCWRVGWRLRIDATRKAQRITGTACPEVTAVEDTARLVEGRLALEATLSGMATLSPADRRALFAVAPADATRQDTVRVAVRRHRARARLLQAIGGGLAGALGWLDAIWRRLRSQSSLALVAPIALIVAIEVGSLVLLPTTGPAQPPHLTADTLPTSPQAGVLQPLGPAVVRPPASVRGSAATPVTGPAPATIAAVPLGGATGVRVSSEERSDPPTACVEHVLGIREVCVDRPGPALTIPDLGH